MVLGQIECEGPYLSISSCSDVRFCDERLVTVSVEVNGRTTFRVNLLSFFSWVVITRFTAFWTLHFTVRWKTYLSMLLIIPLICTANLSLASVNLQSSFLRLAIALFKRRFRIACTSCLLVFGSWKQINFGNTLNDKQFLRKFKSNSALLTLIEVFHLELSLSFWFYHHNNFFLLWSLFFFSPSFPIWRVLCHVFSYLIFKL